VGPPPVRTLLVDNYDSYTWNLFQLLAAVGGAPEVLRNDVLDGLDWADPPYDAVVISPGPGRPERPEDFGGCLDLLRRCPVPVLGVCLGHQGIAYAFGGTVRRATAPMHGRISAIRHDGSDLFRGLPSPFNAVRYHSLLVDPVLPDPLTAIAWTEDGAVMGLRHRQRPLWGVQFHPESVCSEHGAALVRNFLGFAKPRHGRTRAPAAQPPRPTVSPVPLVGHLRVLSEPIDAERAFVHLYGASPHAFWLDSSQRRADAGRFSFLGDASGPHALQLRHHVADEATLISGPQHPPELLRGPLLDTVRAVLAARRPALPIDVPFGLDGGVVGYLGYELKAECDGEPGPRSELPDAQLVFVDRLIAFDHVSGETTLLCLVAPDEEDLANGWLDQTTERLRSLPPLPPPPGPELPPGSLQLDRAASRYLLDVDRCGRWIRDGESYELCLTNTLRSTARPDPLALHRRLRARNPAPYAAFLRLGSTAVVCSSPERFLKVDRDRQIESRPIKGTLPRGATPADDDLLARELASREKFRAENLMIVDLIRNDLGRVCEIGSVEVPSLMAVERYATVLQLVSTIRGRLRPELHATDAVRAAFPPGSMTGAPKRRSMALLDTLEGRARGVYSGAVGYFGLGGAADLNVVIRTAVITPAGTSIGIGGAITSQSEPLEELDEMLLKARALVEVMQALPEAPVEDLRP
jgi:para-aminobenzoate synthetase